MSYKISCVSYLNSKPFIYGIENARLLHDGEVELSLDIPRRCADKLILGEAEIGLVPVASLPLLPHYQIISNYCIGALGAVHSVCLYSDVPLQEVKYILLDYQSMSSVNLTRILCKHHWKIEPNFVSAEKDYISTIQGNQAGVVIGDRTFQLQNQFKYTFDLAEEWMKYSNLPFVFAVWVTTKKLSDSFLKSFEDALAFGIEHISLVANIYAEQYKPYDVHKYLTHYIHYDYDERKEKALHLYLELLKQL